MQTVQEEIKTKCDIEKVTELNNLGVSNEDIAKNQGVDHSTIWRLLKKLELEKQVFVKYNKLKPQALLKNHALSIERTEYMLESMTDAAIDAMTENEKRAWFHTMKVGQGIDNTHYRLESGQSTENHDVAHSIKLVHSEAKEKLLGMKRPGKNV